jgi:dolichol-phosphate mannosyltransferase
MIHKDKLVGIIIPVFHEENTIRKVLLGIESLNLESARIYIIADSDTDPTLDEVRLFLSQSKLDIAILIQVSQSGPAAALKLGIDKSTESFLVFIAGDASDNTADLPKLIGVLDEGYAVASASRYAKGGKHIGGPKVKHGLSRLAGYLTFFVLRAGTSDPTNLFKAARKDFLDSITIESRNGFTIGLELVTKSQIYANLATKECSTVWRERDQGYSNFDFFRWLPSYMYWFVRLTISSLKKHFAKFR